MILTTHRRMMTIDGLQSVSMMHAGRLGAEAYKDKVLGYGPIAYWMLAEAAGVTAIDQVNSPAQDGSHVGVTLGQTGIGDGETCPLFDGVNDVTNIYTTTFRDAFNGQEGTLLIWAKVFNVGVWTDGIDRTAVRLAYDDDTNLVSLHRRAVDYNFIWQYEAGNVRKQLIIGGLSDVDWMPLAITWSKTADQVKAYKDGAQVGATQNGLGVWAGALSNTRTIIGDRTTGVAVPWHGYLAHCIVCDTALSGPDILDLSTV